VMQSTDLIQFLGEQEGRRLRPLRVEDVTTTDDPRSRSRSVLHVQIEGRTCRPLETEEVVARHPNGPRMRVVCDFLNRLVLPCCDESKPDGVYPIELHDSYTYGRSLGDTRTTTETDRDERSYANTLVFARDRRHSHPVLFPDPFQITNYGGTTDRPDVVPWEKKKPVLFFAGTTTGNLDPTCNARVRACVWSLAHRDTTEFYLTRVAQMDAADLFARVPESRRVVHDPVHFAHHHGYRAAFNVAGNTCSWSRVPAVLSSRSVLFDLHQRDMSWWYPALQDGTHYVSVRDVGDDLLREHAMVVSNKARCVSLCDAANKVARDFTRSVHAAQYAKHLFETAAFLNAP